MGNDVELKKRVDELEAELKAIKEKLNEQDEEIPEFPVFDRNGEEAWYMNNVHEIAISYVAAGHTEDYNNFHTEAYAKEFADKCKLFAMMLHCKWYLDRDYVPDWNTANTQKWFICFNCQSNKFAADYEYSVERGCVHFSSEDTAQKCADWLNEHWNG